MDVYYYLPAGEEKNAVECGLKLSTGYDREVVIDDVSRKCFSALLNPRDDMLKYRSADYKCVKLGLPLKYCYVADRFLYDAGLNSPEAASMYLKSIIPLKDYIFGIYRLPECLVACTPITGQISVLDKRIDSPVLFESSEELYINNIIEINKEKYDNFFDKLLYFFYCRLAEAGKTIKIEDRASESAIFTDISTGKPVTLKIHNL
jgi:hypothetical protein